MNNAKLWLETAKPIKTDEEYQEVLSMVEKVERWIEGKWDSPDKKKFVEAHQFLANKLLNYDIEEDKLPF